MHVGKWLGLALLGGWWSAAASEKGLVHLAIAKKQLEARLELLWVDTPGREPLVLRRYPVAIGQVQGDKARAGDLKTPEGIYFTGAAFATNRLDPAKYGPLAIPLQFPNLWDRSAGVSGSGIWLHGAGDDARIAKSYVTEGCVAFYNSDIVDLAPFFSQQPALVSVLPAEVDPVELAQVRVGVVTAWRRWAAAWAERDLPAYIASYADDFRTRGQQSRDAFSRYKSRVFRRYRRMKVELSDLVVVGHPKYALTTMNQRFDGDGTYVVRGRKTLYWKPGPNGWVISHEHFVEAPLEPISSEQMIARLPSVASTSL